MAKEDGKIVGWGTYTILRDYLGNDRTIIHQVLTKKEDSYKKGIEEMIDGDLLSLQAGGEIYFFPPELEEVTIAGKKIDFGRARGDAENTRSLGKFFCSAGVESHGLPNIATSRCRTD